MGSGLPFPRHPHSVLPGLGETPLKGVGAPPQVSESGDRLLPRESQRKTQSPWQGESPFWKPQAWAKGNEAWIQGVCWGGGESSDPWKSQAHLSKPWQFQGEAQKVPGLAPSGPHRCPHPTLGEFPAPCPSSLASPSSPKVPLWASWGFPVLGRPAKLWRWCLEPLGVLGTGGGTCDTTGWGLPPPRCLPPCCSVLEGGPDSFRGQRPWPGPDPCEAASPPPSPSGHSTSFRNLLLGPLPWLAGPLPLHGPAPPSAPPG